MVSIDVNCCGYWWLVDVLDGIDGWYCCLGLMSVVYFFIAIVLVLIRLLVPHLVLLSFFLSF